MTDEEIERDALNREHDRLYKCRDLEISNLWQRSIFLSVFLVLCFTGYGYILMKINDEIEYSQFFPNGITCKIKYLNDVALALCIISFIFSTIMMAKGSKAWYEVYEKAITFFEWDYHEKIGLPEEFIMGERGVPYNKLNNHLLFNAKAGTYSVSKINILIGQICLIIWSTLTIIHICFMYDITRQFIYNYKSYIIPASIIALFILFCYIFHYSISVHLSKCVYNEKGECIIEIKKTSMLKTLCNILSPKIKFHRKDRFKFKKDIYDINGEQKSTDRYSDIQKAILHTFIPIFISDLTSISIKNGIKKNVQELTCLGFDSQAEIADIFLYEKKRKKLFIISTITPKQSIIAKKKNKLKKKTDNGIALVKVTAFMDFIAYKTYKRTHTNRSFYEGEKIWIAEMPEYLFEDQGDFLVCSEKKRINS